MTGRTQRVLIIFLFLLVPAAISQPARGFFNVKDYGAAGNGRTIDSKAINNAITVASEAGGGTVYIPAGNYLCGSIRLRSNVTLYLEQGSTIVATSENPEINYDQAEPSVNTTYQDYGHSHWHNALIWGDSIHDVSVLGPGKIFGEGLVKDWVKDGKTADKSISLHECRNVIIRDVTIFHGGWFAILATGVDNFTIDNLRIDTNRDGIDLDCCVNVHVSNCFINSPHDDGLCLKSSYALGYARATENVTISNCQLSGYDEGTLLDGTYVRLDSANRRPTGRIKFGTESNGGFKNVAISNCVFDYCGGLALETVDGAHLEDITISNLTMRDIVNDPIFLRLGARMRGPNGTPIGELRRIEISNVIVYGADSMHCCTIAGLPDHDIEDVELSNISIYFKGGGTKEQAGRVVPEDENKYPEPGMFGTAPAYGLFARHVSNLRMRDIHFSLLSPDLRPAFVLDDAKGIYMNHVTAEKEGDWAVLKNVSNMSICQSPGIRDQQIETVRQKELK
jgi:polygalacturonase